MSTGRCDTRCAALGLGMPIRRNMSASRIAWRCRETLATRKSYYARFFFAFRPQPAALPDVLSAITSESRVVSRSSNHDFPPAEIHSEGKEDRIHERQSLTSNTSYILTARKRKARRRHEINDGQCNQDRSRADCRLIRRPFFPRSTTATIYSLAGARQRAIKF